MLVWILLFVVGIIIQALLAYKRKPFPEKSPYKQCMSRMKQKRSTMTESIPDERKRLLNSYCTSPTNS